MAFNCIPAFCAGAFWSDEAARLERSKLCGTPGYPWEPCSKTISTVEQILQGSFGGINPSALKPHEELIIDLTKLEPFGIKCAEGYFRNYLGNCQANFRDEFNAAEFFTDVGLGIVQQAALGATFAFGGPLAIAATSLQPIATYYSKEADVGIDLGGIFGGVATALGGLSSGSYLSALQGAGQIGSSFFQQPQQVYSPTPSYAAMPSYGIVPYSPPQAPMQAQPVGAFGVAGRAIATLTAPILAKIAVKLGLRARPSLTRAMDMVRKAAKLLTSPEAVATALGITVAELATLITTSNARKRRRMNPANSKALRRAARRIKSFHRLCTHTDVLKNRGRSRSVSRCGTCKKAPCRC